MALLAMTAVSSAQSDATLFNLVPSAGTLDPAFSSGTIGYTATVPYATANVTLTPTATDPVLPTITVNGATVASGVASAPLPLSVGPNIITTEVVSQDSSTTVIYTLTVTRTAPSANADLSGFVPNAGTLAPVFASGTVDYTATVPFSTSSMRVTPTSADTLATITVNGATVASGSLSSAIPLGVGDTVITTVVTPEDPLTLPKTYTLTVTRIAASTNADLSDLVSSVGALTPTFDSGTLAYTASVPYPASSITVTPTAADPLATIKVKGVTVASGSASGPISLIPGGNVINTVVTAENASTKTYTITVTVTVADPVAIPGGPYTVFTGGTLVLNGSASLASDGNTISSHEWDLDNDGDYDEAITGANPAAISEAVLTGTYAMSLGGNTIKLRVTDSAAKTSVVETTVNILPAVPVVYEPFNYPGTALNGQSGSSEVGFAPLSTWNASVDSKLGPNRAFGPLVTRGAGIGDLQTGVNRYGGARTLNAAALTATGLLNDGATLWFSLMMGYDIGGNVTNSRLAFAFATNQFSTSNFTYNILNQTTPAVNGVGLGVTLGAGGNGRVGATRFSNTGSGFAGNLFGTTSPVLYGAGQNGLIVGKITWGTGGANDVIELYNPGVNLALPVTPISTLSIAVDQSTFDTITWSRGDRVVMDEIRFGGSYQAVIETGSAWDRNEESVGAGGESPSGIWNTDTIWNLAPDGTLVPIPWQPGGVAAFSAGSDATGPYTVTVDGTQDIGGLLFEDGTVTISGGTALRMTANTTVAVNPGLTATIDTPFTEDATSRQLAKAGDGMLVLSGDNVLATGGMNLSAGVAQFESPSAINGTTRNVTIGSGGTMMFGSGFGAGNIPTALLDRVAASSAGAIAADNYDATAFDFSTAGLTAARLGAVGNVNYTGTLTPNGTTYRLGGGGGTLTMANTNALTGTGYSLAVTGNVTLAESNDYTGATTINAGSIVTIMGSSTTSGVTLNTPNTTLILGNAASLGVGTLTVANSFAGPGTLGAVGTVVTTNPVTAGTDFNFGGTGALTIGTVTVSGVRTITNNNITDVSTITSITSSASSSLAFAGNGSTTVTGVIGGGLGITTLSKAGTGILSLNAANTFTGAVTVSGGTLKAGNAAALGFAIPQTTTTANTTISSGATLDIGGTTGLNEPITISGTGVGSNGALVNNSGTPASIDNGIAGATVAATGSGSGYSTPPTVAIVGTGTGATATARLGVTAASFTIAVSGDRVYTVNPTVTIAGGGGSGATATPVMTAGKVTGLAITAAGAGYTTAPTATVSGGTSTGTITTTFTGNATNFCVGGLTMTAAGSGYTGTPTFTFDGVSQTATATRSSVALGAATSIGGSGDMTINAVISGAQALTKVGAGTVTLAGINTYSGAAGTTISAGTLKLGATDVLPNIAVTIGAGTLDAATFTDITIGTLKVTGGATINLGTGAALAFANSSAIAWTDTLTLTGDFVPGASLRFGTTNSGLTPAQLALISKPGGGALDLDANGYLVEATGFASWKTTNGASGQTLDQDHDGDGVSNGVEYFIGGPTGNTTGFTALPGVVDTAGVLSVTWVKAASYTGVYPTDYVVETSDTLTGIWSPETLAPAGNVTDSATQATYTFPTPLGAKKFARLRVTGP